MAIWYPAGVILNVYLNFVHWLESLELSCPSRKYLHLECPGCGIQRGIIALLKGQWIQSLGFYPALVPIILLLIITLIHLRFKFSWGNLVIRYGQVIVVILITGNYIYKIINHKIFV